MNLLNKSIDYVRLVIIPMIVIVLLTLGAGALVLNLTIGSFKEQSDRNSLIYAEHVAEHIAQQLEYRAIIETQLEDELIGIANFVILERDNLDNDWLAQITDMTRAEYIRWFNPNGQILYDAQDMFVGYQSTPGAPSYDFMISGEPVLRDEIRLSPVRDAYFKFVYVRASDHHFVQVGVSEDTYLDLLDDFNYKSAMQEAMEGYDQILYALIMDAQLVAIYDTDEDEIGVDYSDDADYLNVLAGESILTRWFYDRINRYVDEVAVPVILDGEVIGILALGYSLEYFEGIQNFMIIIFFLFAMVILASYIFIESYQIINPLQRLAERVEQFDLEGTDTKDFPVKKGPLAGLYEALNRLQAKINTENAKTKALTKEIRRFALSDFLTRLPNRLGIQNHIDHLVKKQENFVVIFIDLDGFKGYNDTRGHTFGDLLLVGVARSLQQLVDERHFFGRFGGDEFIGTFLYNDTSELHEFLRLVKDCITQPVEVEGSSYHLDASMGVSHYPRDGQVTDELIRKADIAMYHSKAKKKTLPSVYQPEMGSLVSEETGILERLKQAIVRDQFYIVYQPQVDLSTHQVIALEALLRLKDNVLSPMHFIPIAEKYGLITDIGRMVLRKVIEQQATWRNEGLQLLTVYVNFSSHQFEDDTLVAYTQSLLEMHQIEPRYLGIELTESSLIHNEVKAKAMIVAWHELGVMTSLDDFGSGQAGLNYLTGYPMESVKLDKEFSDRYLNEQGIEIFTHVVQLASLLGFNVLAEGIETETQLERLKTTGCHAVQGDFFYPPLDPTSIIPLLKKRA